MREHTHKQTIVIVSPWIRRMSQNLNLIIISGLGYCFGLYLLSISAPGSADLRSAVKTNQSVSFIFMSGLPPTPSFFTKLWLVGYFSGTSWVLVVIMLILTNSILLYAYFYNIIKLRMLAGLFNKTHFKRSAAWYGFFSTALAFILSPHAFAVI